MTLEIDEDGQKRTAATEHRDALLKEYAEVAGNFRLLTNIRFQLLAFLPLAAGAATSLLSAGGGHDAASEVRAFVLSLFGLLITVGLATYNDRNDQLYDTLVGRAANIERQVGLLDGAFANRPTSWLVLRMGRVRWAINHRAPISLIYSASAGLWVFSACAAAVQLIWGTQPAPRGLLIVAILPAIALPAIALRSIRRQRTKRSNEMRAHAVAAVRYTLEVNLTDLANNGEFLRTCSRLGGVGLDDAQARAAFYSRLPSDERRQFLPDAPDDVVGAHFVALISDLPAAWIHDSYTERRKRGR